MEPGGELDVLLVEQIVRMRLPDIILVVTDEIGRHPRGRQAVGFQSREVAIWNAGVEMKAEENIRFHPVGDGDPVGQRKFGVIRPGHDDVPTPRSEQRGESPGPVEREGFLVIMPDAAERAAVPPTVPGVDDDRAVRLWQPINRVDHHLKRLLGIE